MPAERRVSAPVAGLALIAALVATLAMAEDADSRAMSGGATTVFDVTVDAFGRPAANLRAGDLRRFAFGNRLFRTSWAIAPASVGSLDGLGPLFNRSSCSGCHVRDGRGQPPADSQSEPDSMLVRVGILGADGATRPDPRYGGQIQDRAIPGSTPEATLRLREVDVDVPLDDGTVVTLVRPEVVVSGLAAGPLGPDAGSMALVAPAIHGSGLLEAIPLATLAAMADEDDRDGDGISGRLNLVRAAAGGPELPGRFGWKAGQPDVAHQVAAALARDIGITSSMRPDSPAAPAAGAGSSAAPGPDAPAEGPPAPPEIDDDDLAALVFYVRLLGVPARRDVDDPRVVRGETLFGRAGCADCHRPELRTADDAEPPALAGQTIRPYTDLLLHDMGPGLASAIGEGRAAPREWRTPPLWGLGLIRTVNGHTRLLHDGRARGPLEAILWHDGEAAGARRAFLALPADDRRALIAFLESL